MTVWHRRLDRAYGDTWGQWWSCNKADTPWISGWPELGGWKGKRGGGGGGVLVVLMGWIWYTASFRRWGNVRQCPWTFLIDALQPFYCCVRAVTAYSTEPCTEKDKETSNGLWLLSGRGIQTLQFSAELNRKITHTHTGTGTRYTLKRASSALLHRILAVYFWNSLPGSGLL